MALGAFSASAQNDCTITVIENDSVVGCQGCSKGFYSKLDRIVNKELKAKGYTVISADSTLDSDYSLAIRSSYGREFVTWLGNDDYMIVKTAYLYDKDGYLITQSSGEDNFGDMGVSGDRKSTKRAVKGLPHCFDI